MSRCYPHRRCAACGGRGRVETLRQTALDMGRVVMRPCICGGRTTCAGCGAEMGPVVPDDPMAEYREVSA